MTTRELTNTLLIEIPKHLQARVRRRNVGAAVTNSQFVRFGHPGEADITGIIKPGICLEIEVKNGKDRLTKDQASFLQMIREFGGIAIVARDVDTAISDIRTELAARGGAV